MPVLIRLAAFDSPEVLTLRRALTGHYVASYGASDLDDDCPGDFEPPHGAVLVAWRDGQPTGTVSWRRLDDDTAEVVRLYVTPEARGAGIARALTDDAQRRMAGAGYARAIAMTDRPAVTGLAHSVLGIQATDQGAAIVARLGAPGMSGASGRAGFPHL